MLIHFTGFGCAFSHHSTLSWWFILQPIQPHSSYDGTTRKSWLGVRSMDIYLHLVFALAKVYVNIWVDGATESNHQSHIPYRNYLGMDFQTHDVQQTKMMISLSWCKGHLDDMTFSPSLNPHWSSNSMMFFPRIFVSFEVSTHTCTTKSAWIYPFRPTKVAGSRLATWYLLGMVLCSLDQKKHSTRVKQRYTDSIDGRAGCEFDGDLGLFNALEESSLPMSKDLVKFDRHDLK